MASKNTSFAAAIPEAGGKGRSRGKTAPTNPTGAVAGVAKRSSNAAKKLEASKAAIQRTGTAVLHTGETLGTLVAASMAEGFVGPEKLKVGGLDVRAPAGLLAQGFGLYQMIKGEKGGEHALAVGNGAVGSWLASVGREAGEALRERKDGGKTPSQPQPASASFKGEPSVSYPLAPSMQGAPPAGYAPYYGGPAGYMPPPVYGYGQQQIFVPGQGWVPSHALQQRPVAQQAPGGPMAQGSGGLLPEPGPHLSGTSREIMLTPESESLEGAASGQSYDHGAGRSGDGFQGPQMFFTPERQAQLQQQVQQGQGFRQQRRAAIAQQLEQARQQHQAQLAQQGGAVEEGPTDGAIEGDPNAAAQPQPVELGRMGRFRRASVRPVNYDRFPTAEPYEGAE